MNAKNNTKKNEQHVHTIDCLAQPCGIPSWIMDMRILSNRKKSLQKNPQSERCPYCGIFGCAGSCAYIGA